MCYIFCRYIFVIINANPHLTLFTKLTLHWSQVLLNTYLICFKDSHLNVNFKAFTLTNLYVTLGYFLIIFQLNVGLTWPFHVFDLKSFSNFVWMPLIRSIRKCMVSFYICHNSKMPSKHILTEIERIIFRTMREK